MRTSLLLLVILGACSSVRPHVAVGPVQPGIGAAPTPGPMVPPGDMIGPSKPTISADKGPQIQRICRTVAIPRGYVATSYEQSTGCAKKSSDNPYTVAVIERYADLPVGAHMTICDDQRVPSGWLRASNVSPDVDCPGARVKKGAPTSVVIRRRQ